jgi:integrase
LVQLRGKQVRLAVGQENDPPVLEAAWKRFRELIPAPTFRESGLLSGEEAAQLQQGARLPLKRVLCVLQCTGVRPAEICRISAGHFDNEAEGFRLGHRAIPWDSSAPHVEMQARGPATGPLCPNKKGQPWTVDSLCRAFARLRDRLGMRKELTLFSYRHTFAVNHLRGGRSFAEVAGFLGISERQARTLYGGEAAL